MYRMTDQAHPWPFEPKWRVEPGAEIVCGTLSAEGYLVCIPRERAEELAAIHDGVNGSSSWDDFRSRIPRGAWTELAKAFEEAESGPSEPFEADAVPGYLDGDWPDWPAQRMLDWMPEEIRERHGRVEDSVLNGPYLELDPLRKGEIARALSECGFVVREDEGLVTRASGR